MKRVIDFIKTTAIGGLLVIVPAAIIVFVFGRLFAGLLDATTEILDALGISIDEAVILTALAIAILIGICFVTGLLVQTRLGAMAGKWLRRNIGTRIPMFNAISNLTKRFVGAEGTMFAPVEVDLYGTDARVLGFLIESLPDDRCAVFMPTSPVATVGNIVLVEASSVRVLDASMSDALAVISQWGVDVRDLYTVARK